MREQAEPPMPRMRRNLKRERDLAKYAALYEIMRRLDSLPSSLDTDRVFGFPTKRGGGIEGWCC